MLLFQVCLIQQRAVIGIEVELDVPIAIGFRPRIHNSSSNCQTGIDDLQSVFRARETPVVDVRPKRHVAGRSFRGLPWCRHTSLDVVNDGENAEENNDEEKYFLYGSHFVTLGNFCNAQPSWVTLCVQTNKVREISTRYERTEETMC